jgi:peptidoglycan hydrolase-like protein with peptidoglycan-binding domain
MGPGAAAMPQIMISYRREDSGVITGRIFDRLVARYGRDAIFRDIDNIPIGVDFRAHVDQVLGASDVVLAVVGPLWSGPANAPDRIDDEADPVRVEVEAALRKGAPLIPVLVLGAQMPRAAQLPEGLKDFAYRNAVRLDAGQDFDVHMARLTRAVDRVLGVPEAAAADGSGAARPVPNARRPRLLFGAVTVAAALAIAAAGWYFGPAPQKTPAVSGADTAERQAPPQPTPPLVAAPPVPSNTAPPFASGLDPELLFWQTVANSTTAADFEEYLHIYPEGRFAGLARNRLAMLHAPPAPTPAPQPSEPAPKSEPAAPPAVASAPSHAEGEANWTVEEKREVQRALRALGHFQGEPDGGFGPGTRAAIMQFREFSGSSATGDMTEAERRTLLDMTQRLAVLLDQPPNSPQGVAAASLRGGGQRYARAWNFDSGKGTKADPAEAAYWYSLAAADGEAKAFTNLGTLIARGTGAGSKPDPAGAALLWWAAAARGEAFAMFDLGALYERGIGVVADRGRARAWYQRAADHNHSGAREALKRLGA